MSPRESVAHELADTCRLGGLNESYGVNVDKVEDGLRSYWNVTFAKNRILDGVIRVYSPNFILVKWQTAIRTIPRKGSQRFADTQEAKSFITQTFIQE
jgi:hypothetical protein